MKQKHVKHCLTKMNMTAGLRITEEIKERLFLAAALVGLKPSDLIRVGMLRSIEEIEATGNLRIRSRNLKRQTRNNRSSKN